MLGYILGCVPVYGLRGPNEAYMKRCTEETADKTYFLDHCPTAIRILPLTSICVSSTLLVTVLEPAILTSHRLVYRVSMVLLSRQ